MAVPTALTLKFILTLQSTLDSIFYIALSTQSYLSHKIPAFCFCVFMFSTVSSPPPFPCFHYLRNHMPDLCQVVMVLYPLVFLLYWCSRWYPCLFCVLNPSFSIFQRILPHFTSSVMFFLLIGRSVMNQNCFLTSQKPPFFFPFLYILFLSSPYSARFILWLLQSIGIEIICRAMEDMRNQTL